MPSVRSDLARTGLLRRVAERLAAADSGSKASVWKLRKRNPGDRRDLVRLARNLHEMVSALPHGRKVAALRAAGFRGENQSGYLGNLTIPPHVEDVAGDRLRRLTPIVNRYLDVAVGIEPNCKKAIVMLFHGTSFDRPHAAERADQD